MKRVLLLATVDDMIWHFNIPFLELLKEMGAKVESAGRPTYSFHQYLRNKNILFHPIPFSRNPLSPLNIIASFRLWRLIKERKFNLIHTHGPTASFYGRIVGKLAGVETVIYTAHGFHFHRYGERLTNIIFYLAEWFASHFVDAIIVINEEDFQIARKKFPYPEKIELVRGVGVDLNKFSPQEVKADLEALKKRIGLSSSYCIGVVAEWIPRKRVQDVVRTTYILAKRGWDISALIVGYGPLKEDLKKEAKELGIEDRVIILDYQVDPRPYYLLMDVFMLTSRQEGLPKVVMEAMAMERPVVGYDIRGMVDLVSDGETGFLCPFKNIRCLADKVEWLLSNPEERRKMGEAGRRRLIEGGFTLEDVKKRMKEIYQRFL